MSFTRISRALCGATLLPAGLRAASGASAQTVDYTNLFRTKILKCVHPTVSADKATYEVVKGPGTAGDITTVRLKVFAAGLIGKNAMDADLMVRQVGSIRQARVNVLSDTGTTITKCAMTSGWSDFRADAPRRIGAAPSGPD